MSYATTLGRALAAYASLLLAVSGAMAQDDPEAGDVGGGVEAEGEAAATWSPPGGSASAGGSASSSSYDDDGDSGGGGGGASTYTGDTDHSQFVGRFGVGWFGVMSLPTCAQGCAGGSAPDQLQAPTIGARYWLDEKLAIEGGLGIAWTSGSVETTAPAAMGTMTTTVEDPSLTGLGLHGGVPYVLADTKHVAFEVVPQMNIGITTGSAPNGALADTEFGGFLFEIGSTIGAEVHFGFMDLPSLALQGNVGLMLRYQSASVDQPTGMNATTTTDVSRTALTTTVGNDPWDIFTGGITAIYYM